MGWGKRDLRINTCTSLAYTIMTLWQSKAWFALEVIHSLKSSNISFRYKKWKIKIAASSGRDPCAANSWCIHVHTSLLPNHYISSECSKGCLFDRHHSAAVWPRQPFLSGRECSRVVQMELWVQIQPVRTAQRLPWHHSKLCALKLFVAIFSYQVSAVCWRV